jgi:hypothetical protein
MPDKAEPCLNKQTRRRAQSQSSLGLVNSLSQGKGHPPPLLLLVPLNGTFYKCPINFCSSRYVAPLAEAPSCLVFSVFFPTEIPPSAVRIRPTTTQDSTSIPARFQRAVIHPASQTTVVVDASSSAPTSAGPPATASSAPPSVIGTKKQSFTFDQVHPPPTTQHALFTSTALPLISRFVEGFNCTILAYGQTSSGKTFTMTGIDLDADPSDPNNGMGIIPRAVSTIFSRARQLKEERGGAWNWNIKGSFIEIYNEDLIDLLSIDDASGGRREVLIREDKDGNIIWGGLREINVKNTGEVMTYVTPLYTSFSRRSRIPSPALFAKAPLFDGQTRPI